jgi:hypothetical protein
MSGHPDDHALQQLVASGRPLIRKPFTGEELAGYVERVLAGR